MKVVFSNSEFFSLVAQELAEEGKVRFRVKGVSMQPLLRNDRDEVLLEKCNAYDLKKGDIILFRYLGGHILHRIYKIEAGKFYMKGDNTYGAKEFCWAEDILGKVTTFYRQIGSDGTSYQEEDPYTFKKNLVSRMWRTRCSIYRYLSALKRRLFS